jgi:hypothetical protein
MASASWARRWEARTDLTLAIQVILAGSSCPCKWENTVKTKTPLIVTASKNSPPVMMQSTPVNEASANVRTHLWVSVRPFSFQALAIRADEEAYTQGGGEIETQRGVQTGASMALTVARALVQIR